MQKISDSTVRRLSVYLRFLEAFEREGSETISSEELATRGGTTSAQVRKDLSFFGSFGKRGLGYDVHELATRLRDILGLERSYAVVLLGAGKLGSALAQWGGFVERGFHMVAAFDVDPAVVGRSWNGLGVRDAARLEADLAELKPDIAIIATPPDAAQRVADRLVASGVRALLNFTSVQLNVGDQVAVKDVNMALELEALSFALRNAGGS